MDAIAPYYKAVTALVVPFLTLIGAALLPTSDGGSTIMANEWITAVVTALIAGGAVFSAPKNREPERLHSVSPDVPAADS